MIMMMTTTTIMMMLNFINVIDAWIFTVVKIKRHHIFNIVSTTILQKLLDL